MQYNPNSPNVIEGDPSVLDWRIDGETGLVGAVVNPTGSWRPYLPDGELQFRKGLQIPACVSFSATHIIVTYFNYLISQNKLSSSALDYLKTAGYMIDGKLNFSERYIAHQANTTTKGVYLRDVWEAIRKYGLVPENDWPWVQDTNQYLFTEVPQEIVNKGQNFLKYFNIKWDWITAGVLLSDEYLKQSLTVSPIQLTVYGGGHAVECFEFGSYWVQDSFDPYIKHFDEVTRYAIRCEISEVSTIIPIKPHVSFYLPMQMGETSSYIMKLQMCLNWLGYLKVKATGYYGENTRKAVARFQLDYAVAPLSELAEVQGRRVGYKTITKLNQLFGTGTGSEDTPKSGLISSLLAWLHLD